MFDWIDQYVTAGQIAVAIRLAIIVIVGIPSVFILSKWLRGYVTKRHSPQHGLISGKILLYGGLLIILFSVLNELGFKLTHLVAAAGVTGVIVGFAAQTSVSNIISGFFLMAERPFVVGDAITVGSTSGEVLSIDMLSIKLRTFENKFVRIPNEAILKSELTNITHFPIRRVDLPVGIAYKEDVARVREILLDIAHRHPLCLQEPESEVRFSGFGTSSIDLIFVLWVERTDFLKVKTAVQEEIKKRFDEEGIEIPFPHLSLYRGSATEPITVKIEGAST